MANDTNEDYARQSTATARSLRSHLPTHSMPPRSGSSTPRKRVRRSQSFRSLNLKQTVSQNKEAARIPSLSSPSFAQLPLLPHPPPVPTVHFPALMDVTFHSFTLSSEKSVLLERRACSPLSLSQAPSPTDQDRPALDPIQIPALSHPNSPYVPWASPIRRGILLPLTPMSQASSYFSRYSRPHSRSGARAPEPDLDKRIRMTSNIVARIVRRLKSLRRIFSSRFSRRLKKITGKENQRVEPAQPPIGVHSIAMLSCPSATSFESLNTTSRSTWLSHKHTAGHQWSGSADHSPALEEYGWDGSWLNLGELQHGMLTETDLAHTVISHEDGGEPYSPSSDSAHISHATFRSRPILRAT